MADLIVSTTPPPPNVASVGTMMVHASRTTLYVGARSIDWVDFDGVQRPIGVFEGAAG
jgi:hypothetical protein